MHANVHRSELAPQKWRWNGMGSRPFNSRASGPERQPSPAEMNSRMADLCGYAPRPLAFIFRYIRLRPLSHAAIIIAVLGAVVCSVGTQYGVKFLVDTLSKGHAVSQGNGAQGYGAAVWLAFALLGSLIAADNLLWRIASW